MDATVNDFLNEIDQIVPLEKKNQCAWQECFDDKTGYSYYWNINTDQVTWEMPDEYKKWLKTNEKTKIKPTFNSHAKPAPLFPSTSLPVSVDSIKIYKIENEAKIVKPNCNKTPKTNKTTKIAPKPPKRNDSDDEKIVLISSYGGDTDSEDEKEEENDVNFHKNDVQKNSSKHKEDVEDTNDEDILSQIQNRAKVLQKLGGDLPPDVKNLVEPTKLKETKEISGFSLLAAYGDSDEEDEKQDDHPQLFPAAAAIENKISHSTLFPIRKPIDVKQFCEESKPENTSEEVEVDKKPFQRKRRIGIDLPNTCKRPKNEQQKLVDANETVGLGFNKNTVEYPGFKSGGVMFVKSDVLNPTIGEDTKDCVTKDKEADLKKMNKSVEKTMTTLSEKLKFLSEGRSSVSPVQVIIIQLETLDTALKAGGLSVDYLEKYLNEVHSDLAKLEKEATPQGWLLQWDRLNKRYYYQNEATGESQWEYPQTDIIGGDVAMDISMTPPRGDNEDSQESVPSPVSTPPPPRIKDPTPPPPPKISNSKTKTSKRKEETDPPLPPPEVVIPLPPLPPGNGKEPLPPGVESNEVTSLNTSEENPSPQTKDSLNTALSSFYSDLAAIESNSPAKPTATEENVNVPSPVTNTTLTNESGKKKKKTKVKLTQGLAMKKKGVSKLVEKWKNVQKNYL